MYTVHRCLYYPLPMYIYISPDGSRADHRTVALADEGQEGRLPRRPFFHFVKRNRVDLLLHEEALAAASLATCHPPPTRSAAVWAQVQGATTHIRPGPSRRVDNVRKETKSLHSRKRYYVASSSLVRYVQNTVAHFFVHTRPFL